MNDDEDMDDGDLYSDDTSCFTAILLMIAISVTVLVFTGIKNIIFHN